MVAAPPLGCRESGSLLATATSIAASAVARDVGNGRDYSQR